MHPEHGPAPAAIPTFLVRRNPLQRAVSILPDDDGSYRVLVLPRIDGDPAASIVADIETARAFATGMAVCHGYPVSDLTGQP